MGRTMAEKVWEAHLVHKGENGEPDLLYVDLHLGPDNLPRAD